MEATEKEVQLFEVDPSTLTLAEERTKMIPLPTKFYFEADPASVTKSRGHQVDGSRPASWVAIMPSVQRLEDSGNPYPEDVNDPSVQPTAESYRALVVVAHATYAALAAQKELPASFIPDGHDDSIKLRMIVRDALRDLTLYGLSKPVWVGKKKVYRLP